MEDKWFECQCVRCLDPTELGTHGSTLICPACHKGHVVPCSSAIDWKCSGCPSLMASGVGTQLMEDLHSQSQDLLKGPPSVVNIERFLARHQGKTAHPNHMSLMNLKFSLCGFYGRVQGYTMNEMTEDMLKRKRQLCEDTLTVLNKIDAGPSPRKGKLIIRVRVKIRLFTTFDLSEYIFLCISS